MYIYIYNKTQLNSAFYKNSLGGWHVLVHRELFQEPRTHDVEGSRPKTLNFVFEFLGFGPRILGIPAGRIALSWVIRAYPSIYRLPFGLFSTWGRVLFDARV